MAFYPLTAKKSQTGNKLLKIIELERLNSQFGDGQASGRRRYYFLLTLGRVRSRRETGCTRF